MIGLPRNLFYNTDIAACVLVFASSTRRRAKNEVLFADAAQCFQRGVNQHVLADGDIDEIAAVFAGEAAENTRVRHRLVKYKEIEEQNFSFHLGRYLGTVERDSSAFPQAREELAEVRLLRQESEQVMLAEMRAAGLWPTGGDDDL